MKAIGTITNYFPFLSEDTISIMQSVMRQADNYYDFTIRLATKICEEEVSHEVAFMGAAQLFHTREVQLQEQVRKKYLDRPEIVIFTFPLRSGADFPIYRDEYHEVLKRVMDSNLPDWMLAEIIRPSSFFFQTPTDYSEGAKEFRKLLDSNPSLGFFEAHYHDLVADMYNLEGDHVNAVLKAQQSLEAARAADDVYFIMGYTGFLSHLLRNHNIKAAMEYIEEYHQLNIYLGIPWTMTLARNRMGIVYWILGEYDMAIECQVAALEIYYHDKGPSDTLSSVISVTYCELGDGLQTLEWSDNALSSTDGTCTPIMHYSKTWALSLLGRLDDAEENLDLLHQSSLKSAGDNDTVMYLHARGLFELTSGMPREALHSLTEALEIIESQNHQVVINRILISLVQAEIQLIDESSSDDSSGPWMVRLETHARKRNYPGIQIQAALLRAEYLIKIGRIDDARKILQESLTILDSPTVKTLRYRIEKMISELEV